MRSIRHAVLALAMAACTEPNAPQIPEPSPPSPATTTPATAPDQRQPFPARVEPRATAAPATPSDTTLPAASGRLVTLSTTPAHGAVLLGPRAVVLAPDFQSVAALDVTTGAEIWRVPLPGHPAGQHILQRLGDRPLLRRGDDLLVFDVTTGHLAAHHRLAMGDRGFLHERLGMCMLNGSCSAQIVGCDDARPLGPALEGVRIFRHPLHHDDVGHGGDSCSGFRLQLLGRAGDALVYSGHGLRRPPPPPSAPQRPRFGGASVLAAIHADNGKTLWEHEGRGCGFCGGSTVGVSPDRKLGWLSRDQELEVFSTRDGSRRWTRRFDDPLVTALWVDGGAPGLFVTSEGEVALFAPGGQPRFRRPRTSLETLPLLRDAVVPEPAHAHLFRDQKQLAWLDPPTGEAIETVSLEGKVLLADERGHPVLGEHGEAHDAAGQVIQNARHAFLDVERKRRPDSGDGPPNQAIVRERHSRAELLRIDHDAWSLGEWPGPGEPIATLFAVLYVHRGEEPGEVRVVRFEPF